MKVSKPNYGMHYGLNDELQVEQMPHAYVVHTNQSKRIGIRELIPHNKYLNGSYFWTPDGTIMRLKNDYLVTRPNS